MLLICAISVVGPKKYRRKDFVIRLSEAGDFKESGETFAEVAREKFILTPGNRRLTHWKSGTNPGKQWRKHDVLRCAMRGQVCR